MKHGHPSRSTIVVVCFVVTVTYLAPAPIAASSTTPSVPAAAEIHRAPGYLETVLDNGLRVALLERNEVPMVCATAMVGAGSALESEDFSGASHFLEHLLFNGTSNMDQKALYDAVDRIGGYNNAHTDEDHTYFIMLVPAIHARQGLAVQAAMLFDSILPPDKFDKERKIVLEEIARDRSRPSYEADLAVRRALSPATPYGRPVIGTYESLAGIDRERVWTYYKTRYVPGNVLLLVMGDFEADAMLAQVREIYGAAGAGPSVPPVPDPFSGPGAGTLTRVAVDGPTTEITLVLPAPDPCETGGREAEVLARVLSGESGPLRRVLGPGRAIRLSASYMPRPAGSGLNVTVKVAGGADPDEVVTLLLQTLEATGRRGWCQPGFEPAEVTRVVRAARAEDLLTAQRIHHFAMLSADTLAACRGPVLPLVVPGEAGALDPEAVAGLAGQLLTGVAHRARVVAAGPFAERAGTVALEEPPPPEPLPSREASTIPGADLDRALPNGLRVLVSRERGAPITGFHLLVRDRAAREPEGKAGIADLLHRLLPLGTLLSGRASLAARLERLGAGLKTADSDFIPYDDYYTSPTYSFVRLEVPSGNWLPALDLLAELVRLPLLEESAFTSQHASRLARARTQAASPSEVGKAAYRAVLLGEGHPLTRPVGGSPESLGRVAYPDLKAFAADYLDPAGLILGVAGPGDPDDVFGAVAERFDAPPAETSWPSTPSWPVTGDPGPAVEREVGADQSQIYLGRIAPLPASDRAAARLLSNLLSDRLARTLREEEGLAYGLGAGVSFSADPDLAWLSVQMGTRPENLEVALAGLRAQVDRLRLEMATPGEIDRIRAERRGRALMRRMTAVNRARFLTLRAFLGVAAHEDLDALEAMDRVTREQLERVAGEWLDPDRFQVVIVR